MAVEAGWKDRCTTSLHSIGHFKEHWLLTREQLSRYVVGGNDFETQAGKSHRSGAENLYSIGILTSNLVVVVLLYY